MSTFDRLVLQANASQMTNLGAVKEARGCHRRYREPVRESTSQQKRIKRVLFRA